MATTKKRTRNKDRVSTNQLDFLKQVVIPNMRKHICGKPFLHPVDTRTVTDYLDFIKNPMDLGTVRSNLASYNYINADECLRDITLIFDNCFVYNKEDTEIYQAGKRLHDYFLQEIASMPAQEERYAISPKSSPPMRSQKRRRSDDKPKARTKPKQVPKPPPGQYLVDKLIAMRKHKGVLQFLIHWKGYGDEEDEWVAKDDIAPDLIHDWIKVNGPLLDLEEDAIFIHVKEDKKRFCDFCADVFGEKLVCSNCDAAGHKKCIKYDKKLFERCLDDPDWECLNCKGCIICHERGGEAEFFICDECDKGLHGSCLKPVQSEVPEGKFLCIRCDPSNPIYKNTKIREKLKPEVRALSGDSASDYDPSGEESEISNVKITASIRPRSSDDSSTQNEKVEKVLPPVVKPSNGEQRGKVKLSTLARRCPPNFDKAHGTSAHVTSPTMQPVKINTDNAVDKQQSDVKALKFQLRLREDRCKKATSRLRELVEHLAPNDRMLKAMEDNELVSMPLDGLISRIRAGCES